MLDFGKAGQISGIDRGKIKAFINTILDGLPQSRDHCRTIYIKAASNKTDYFDPVIVGLYNLENEAIMTEKTFFFDVSFTEAESDTIRAMLKPWRKKAISRFSDSTVQSRDRGSNSPSGLP